MNILLSNILVFLMLLIGCDSTLCMRDYYSTNKNNLINIRTLSNTLSSNYSFEQVTIKKKNEKLELIFFGGVSDNVSMYLNPSNLDLIHEFSAQGCSAEVHQRFRTMYQDNTMRGILNLFELIDPKAVRITHGGVFVALGRPLKHPNVNLNGGILMTFAPGVSDYEIVEEIDANVYLYDALVY